MNTNSRLYTSARLARTLAMAALALVFIVASSVVSSAADEAPAETTTPATPKGSLYLIGGAADSTLKDLVDLAGGAKANIVIIPHASSVPAEAADEMANAFTSLGVKTTQIQTLLPGSKVGLPQGATCVYICGGDQNRLMRLLEPQLIDQLHKFYMDGGIISGSSAGAAAASPIMIAGGMTDGQIRKDSLRTAKGLGFLPGTIIDTHCRERSRFDRSMVAVTIIDDVIAIALDEDTAIHVKDGKAKVYGKGYARLFRRTSEHNSDVKSADPGVNASVHNVTTSSVAAGSEFTIPAPPKAKTP